jgi:hypothetical protein
MSVFETMLLINETGNLIGQMMFDVLSVTFAILAAGFVMGERLNNGMISVITILSGFWVLPMLANAYSLFMVMSTLAENLTKERLGDLSELAQYTGSESLMVGLTPYPAVAAHLAIYLGSIWFLFYCSKNPGYLSR